MSDNAGDGSKPDVLVLLPIFPPVLAALEAMYAVHKLWLTSDRAAFLRAVAPRIRGVVTSGLAGCDVATMQALPLLEIIACYGSPRSNLDVAAAKTPGIVCTRTPDDITGSVADLALGLMLAAMRRIAAGDRFIRAGHWEKEPERPGREVRDKSCGIVGMGAIGQAVAKRVAAFDMSVCYYGPRKKETPHAYFSDLTAMAREVDVLIVCCPLLPETRNLVNATVIEALGHGTGEGFLINVARGAVVNEAALISALQHKRLAGAGLDVFWDEPRVPAALLALDNVVLAPHVGSNTQEVREERGRKMLADLEAHFAGRPVAHRIPDFEIRK